MSFSYVPIRLMSYLGAVISFISFLYAVFLIVRRVFYGLGGAGWPSVMVTMLFLGGVQLIMLGVLGEYIWNQEVIPPEEQWRTGVENCKILGDYAAKLGVQLALELEPFKLSLLNSVDTMVRFIDDCDHDAVRANIDVSHLLLADVAPEELRRLRGKAIHCHISDCDGKVHGDLPPGRGVVPFEPYLKEIKDLGFEGAMSIELEYSPEPDKIVEWVDEAYRETDKLMQAVGLRD